MNGNKILQAKEAANYIINNLNEGDYFNIIDFSTTVESFADEHESYDAINQDEALPYIENIDSGGGTNISEPLLQAIMEFDIAQPNKANIIIFLTDGRANSSITNTTEILEAVESLITQYKTKIFYFTKGAGENIDKGLPTLLSQENNGLIQFFEPKELVTDLTQFFLEYK